MKEELKNELDKIEDKICKIKSYQTCCINEMKTYKKEQIVAIILLVIADSTLPVILASFGHVIAAIAALASATAYSAANYIIKFNKIKKLQKNMEEAQNQIDYLDEVKSNMKKEIENTKDWEVTLTYINNKYNWRKRIKLMNVYNKYKKSFIKHLKKGDLYELLQDSGYDNQESYYLYERARKEQMEKEQQKILKKVK